MEAKAIEAKFAEQDAKIAKLEKIIEATNKENLALKTKVESLEKDKSVDGVVAEMNTLKTKVDSVEGVVAKMTSLEGIVTEVADDNAELKAIIKDLDGEGQPKQKPNKVEKKVPLKTPDTTFKVDGSTYKFKVPSFRIHVGPVLEVVKSEAALKDAEMQARLVKEKRFGIIQKVK